MYFILFFSPNVDCVKYEFIFITARDITCLGTYFI